ncbi:alpha/beta fold hydrolase [Kitasatospora sp. NA04385]|uniref:alpha/beta hydrolase n=1 Tax=Kitasatospora sp. NA04385 TaxID=2742135 RepID=UPI00159165F2|nr:alpha/beta hydrolase [Kitasatospora sp. NA04385]QKW22099.1 alpha/beta fold hydrolase [Kitasatospora sp. NA04385]
MRILHRGAALAAATTVLLGLTAPLALAAPAPAADRLAWGACPAGTPDARQQCAELAVPLDYARPGGPSISLAVSRISTARPELRRGVLVLIPGGPGGSGLNGPAGAVERLPRSVLDRYDLIGFDPRGVGRSTPLDCGFDHADLAHSHTLPWPAPDGGIDANLATARRMAAACAADGGELVRSISTRNEARDVDRIRQALGERRISLWGVSYGTYAGAVYATLFADRTDRVLLDSNDDPDPTRVERGWLANYATGVADRFPDFAAWAASPAAGEYRLGDTPEQVRAAYLATARQLDDAPLPWPGANPERLDGNALRSAMLENLYADAGFPRLAELVQAARGSRPLPVPGAVPEAAVRNGTSVSLATLCNDVSWPRDPGSYAPAVAADRAAHPLTAGMPVNVTPCAFWPWRPAEPPVRVGSAGPSNVLLVQNLRDPATPYSGALKMRAAFGDRARMVAVDSGGHDAYLANGNACGDALVTEFLATGRRPARDAFCPKAG